jgi:hypothetical protein
MFTAAFSSASATNPQDLQTNSDWLRRFAFSRCPHSEQVCEVRRGSAAATATPASLASYSTNALSSPNAHLPCLELSNRGPRADALQVFETDTSFSAGGFRYQPLGDYVVGVLRGFLHAGKLCYPFPAFCVRTVSVATGHQLGLVPLDNEIGGNFSAKHSDLPVAGQYPLPDGTPVLVVVPSNAHAARQSGVKPIKQPVVCIGDLHRKAVHKAVS